MKPIVYTWYQLQKYVILFENKIMIWVSLNIYFKLLSINILYNFLSLTLGAPEINYWEHNLYGQCKQSIVFLGFLMVIFQLDKKKSRVNLINNCFCLKQSLLSGEIDISFAWIKEINLFCSFVFFNSSHLLFEDLSDQI